MIETFNNFSRFVEINTHLNRKKLIAILTLAPWVVQEQGGLTIGCGAQGAKVNTTSVVFNGVFLQWQIANVNDALKQNNKYMIM